MVVVAGDRDKKILSTYEKELWNNISYKSNKIFLNCIWIELPHIT